MLCLRDNPKKTGLLFLIGITAISAIHLPIRIAEGRDHFGLASLLTPVPTTVAVMAIVHSFKRWMANKRRPLDA